MELTFSSSVRLVLKFCLDGSEDSLHSSSVILSYEVAVSTEESKDPDKSGPRSLGQLRHVHDTLGHNETADPSRARAHSE